MQGYETHLPSAPKRVPWNKGKLGGGGGGGGTFAAPGGGLGPLRLAEATAPEARRSALSWRYLPCRRRLCRPNWRTSCVTVARSSELH